MGDHMLTRWSDTSAFVVSFVSQSSFTSTFSTLAFFSFFIAVASSFNPNLNQKLHRLLLLYLINKKYTFEGGSLAEWSARRTRNPEAPSSSAALATLWNCSRSSRVQILGHACKWLTGCLLSVGVFIPVML